MYTVKRELDAMNITYFEEAITELKFNLSQQPDITDPVIFYGSSSFRMWTSVREDLKNNDILNMGFGGSTLEACDYYFEELLLSKSPKAMVVYAGDNDLGEGQLPEQIYNSFLSILDKVQKYFPSIPLAFVSIKPSPSKDNIQDRIERANALIEAKIKELSNVYYIDIYNPMLDKKGNSRPDFFVEDMLHMNKNGYKVWTDVISQFNKDILY